MVYGLEPFRPKPPPRRATSTAGNDSLRSTIRFRARSRPTPERTSLSLLCKGHDSEVHLARALLSWHCFIVVALLCATLHRSPALCRTFEAATAV